jgi:hypothetical protein
MGLLVVLLVTIPSLTAAQTSGNIDPTDKWAWATNAGWLNFRPLNGGAAVYPDHLEGFIWSENAGWIRLGTYDGGSIHTYLNTSAADYGINNDGAGQLSGFAWGTAAGWVNFDPAGAEQVTIDPVSKSFDGYAWAENLGWIHFKNAVPAYNVVTTGDVPVMLRTFTVE